MGNVKVADLARLMRIEGRTIQQVPGFPMCSRVERGLILSWLRSYCYYLDTLSVVVGIAKLTLCPESETVGCMGTMLLVELNLFQILG